MFEQAIALFRQGRLGEAEGVLLRLLQASPDHFDALHLRGLIARHTQRSELAVELISRAIRQNARVPAAYRHRANALADLHRLEEAVENFDVALGLKPDFVEAHVGRGFALLELERPRAALESFERAIALRGATLAAPHYGRAAALLALGRAAEALQSSDLALGLRPDVAEGLIHRAAALRLLQRPAEALQVCEQAISRLPQCARTFAIQGAALADLARNEESLASFERSLELQPDDAMAHNGRGSVLLTLCRPQEALASFECACSLRPQFAIAHNNRGVALGQLSEFGAAGRCYQRAIELDPHSPEPRLNAAHLHLQLGEFEAGWRLYEARPREGLAARPLPRPEWRGDQALDAKDLLLVAEQGLGDTIQFCRYVPLLERLGARVILWAPAVLLRLLRTASPTLQCVADTEPAPACDFHCRMLSVPHALSSRMAAIPAQIPYLSAEPGRVAYWRQRLGDAGFRIGIAWQGALSRMDLGRSFAVRELQPIARLPGVRLINLQKGSGTDQLRTLPTCLNIEQLSPFDEGPDAFVDTAALMQCLDLVISSDTSIAHLAGALGRPTWVALQNVPDWRWQLHRDDSPWYPHMRLFRQSERGHWGSVFEQMRAALQAHMKSNQLQSSDHCHTRYSQR
jgi:tetratricopeptide (TPR) repeat protein